MNSRLRSIALGAIAPLLVVAACDRSPAEPHDHHALGTVIILDRSTVPHTPIATWTHAGGWNNQNLMNISHSAEENRTRVSLGAQMLTRGGEPIELSSTGEYSFRYGVSSDPNNLIDMNVGANLFHGDHVHIYGRNDTRPTGTAQVVFALWHDDHDDGLTTPITVTFVD